MWIDGNLIFNKKPNYPKLIEYGFAKKEEGYIFSCDLIDGAFRLDICISDSGYAKLAVWDKETNDEYALVHNKDAVGSFVGRVRSESEKVFSDVVAQCYDPDIFKSEYAQLVIKYIRDKYNIDAEYLWEKFPNNAIFRESQSQKWFAALLTVERRKLGIDEDGAIEIIDLKNTPDNIIALVDGKTYLAGYHMNKKHWYTMCLDGSVPIEEIYSRIDSSFYTLNSQQKKYFIKTARCGFSCWTERDLPSAYALWGESAVTQYICARGVFSPEEIKNRLYTEIENYKKYGVQYFPFYALDNGELIGCCGLRPYKDNNGVYELGFHLRKEFWHNGYATEAATAIINYAFYTLKAIELKAGHNPNNIASSKVLSKLGFQYECDEFYEPTGLNHPLYCLKQA